jgi:hypothetical protein
MATASLTAASSAATATNHWAYLPITKPVPPARVDL